MKSETFKIKFVFAAIVLIGFFAAVFATSAQTPRRRTNRPVQPIVLPTPLQTLPVIISRADDIPSENQTTISEPIAQPPEETVDDKIDASNQRIKELNTRIKSLESTRKNE
ncbi:MAG TPA: hypothetical protein VNI60_04500, partial [Pyrinomonadaceae bacterium]|nr:hypothetical protein [Pyrinomonadaceae bacterium]